MIGDTDFFIDLMHPRSAKHEAAVAKARELDTLGVRIAMTAVTRFELAAGVERFVKPDAERGRIKALLAAHSTYELDGNAADLAGSIYGSLQSKGITVGVADCLIAATALASGQELLTRNRKDFNRIEGLSVVSY